MLATTTHRYVMTTSALNCVQIMTYMHYLHSSISCSLHRNCCHSQCLCCANTCKPLTTYVWSSTLYVHRYEMKATGRADLAPNEKVMDLYTSNLQLEKELHGVRRQVDDAKAIAEKV